MNDSLNNGLTGRKAAILQLVREQRLAEALAACRRICADEPDEAGNWFMLASIHGELGQVEEAIASYDAALQRQPGHLLAWLNKGIMLEASGATGQAGQCYRKALDIRPDFAQAWYSLGNLMFRAGNVEGAAESYRKAVQYKPDYIEALANLGKLQQSRCQFSAAEQYFRTALENSPENADLCNELGMSLNAQGQSLEAEQAFRQALSIAPAFSEAGSNLLLTLNYTAGRSPEQGFVEHRRQGRIIHEQVCRQPDSRNDTDPQRRLRIGYVSADFREHSVASFFMALLEHHDRARVEPVCYADVGRADAVTERLQGLSAHWRDIRGLPDGQVIKQMQADKVDILVDLAGHTAGNRLPAFAARPAPVQVTWLGYPNTTGLEEMDYRITDAWSDPPGVTDAWYTESLVRLPGCFLCYTPPLDAPLPVKDIPSDEGWITFGSFNSYVKMTAEVFQTWSDILKAAPGSRLLLKNFSLTDPEVRDACRSRFAALGIDAERLELHGVLASRREHLALYGKVDVGLDTFPYNGTTTTCEAVWMGIPVVTLAGDRHAGRVGVSLMNALGLQQLIAHDTDEYRRLAASLAANTALRREWRASMREVMRNSSLCDGTGFARDMESAYREMWTRWCADQV